MTVTLHVPDELVRRLEADAAARGISVEELAVELLSEHTTTPAEPQPATQRRRLALAGIGASGTGISHRIDELLADGFGRE